ncbi:RNA-directed DNA polymerase, eukaryota, reverse transcriptase zinc-binding domain protein, partial [Tanacetum coccineum]
MRSSRRVVKPTKIFDNSVNNTSKNKNKQKNVPKKKDMFSKASIMLADLDGENDLVNGDEIVRNGDMDMEGIDTKVCNQDEGIQNCPGVGAEKGMVNNDAENERFKECLGNDDGKTERNDNGISKGEQDSVSGKEDNTSQRTYAKMVTKDVKVVNNKLDFVPTVINEGGINLNNIRRMWSGWGIDDIDMKADGTCMFKFINEEGMNKVLELGPWLAWSTEGISALARSLGKPLIMDNMTAKRCQFRERRLNYARVLVEFDVRKGCKDKIVIQYRDKYNNVKGSKKVNVEYAWKLEICNHCNVFGHCFEKCTKRDRSAKEIEKDRRMEEDRKKQDSEETNRIHYVRYEVGNRRPTYMRQNKERRTFLAGGKRNEVKGSKGEVWKKKHDKKEALNRQKNKQQVNGGTSQREGRIDIGNKYDALNRLEDDNKELEILKGRIIVDRFITKDIQPNGVEVKTWTRDMVRYFKDQKELKKIREEEELNDGREDVMESNSGIASELNAEEVRDLKMGMWNIRSMNQSKKQESVLNFIQNEKISICGIVETHLKPPKISKAANKAFGGWDWVSNSVYSTNSCRILVGWDKNKVNLMVVHMTKQVMLTVIEILKPKQKFFCSFVYASNSGLERRSLWKDLRGMKSITSGYPWILMGDFNVTLKIEEHSAGGSRSSGDMQDFMDCVNDIEVEDVNQSGLLFTWIKSPSKPDTSIMKKLDRFMINSEFLSRFGGSNARFHPFLISDHSPVVMHIPNSLKGLVKKMKNLKGPLKNLAWKNGNLFQYVKSLEDDLKKAQIKVEANPYDTKAKEDMTSILHNYNEALNDEEKLLAQKAKSRIMGISDEKGNWFEGEMIPDQFVKHFQAFLNKDGDNEQIEVEGLFKNILSPNEANFMIREVSDKKVKDAMFGIGDDKA